MGIIFSTCWVRKNIKSKRASLEFEGVQNEEDKAESLKYYLPNFIGNIDTMVIFHFLGQHLFQSNFNAPIVERLSSEQCKVLDVCCGAGTWLLDMASAYGSTNFFGIDLCPVFPTEIKPANVQFTQGDVLDGLPFDDNTFDYVHQGHMVDVYTLDQWHFAITEIIRVCKQGGYVEFAEPELATNSGPILSQFYDAFVELSEARNVKIRMYDNLIRTLNSTTSVQNVESKKEVISLGTGFLGNEYLELHHDFFLKAMPETLSKFMGLSEGDYIELFKKAKNEVENGISPDCELYRIWCQKL
ncbi:5449_t:CDS:2 [Funneliformis caledonium]|uniref:5449_t:CDS:1 n=1 Tax=Funneliformis caledonium TaxID=1117310 RepID=A0A9N8VGH0_9GLOM|nr:5449_t:CDS:2 [Funneliformis caledonium]